MAGKIENKYGSIYIEPEVVAKIAGRAAVECYGLVGLASKSVKNGIVELLKFENMSKGVTVELTEESLAIELYVIIQYGTKISEVAHNIMDRVKYSVENQTGLDVTRIDVKVQGIRVGK